MISKKQTSFITSLHQKKFRRSEGLFIAEGEKVVGDLLDSDWEIRALYFTERCSLPLSRMSPGRISGEMAKISEEDLQRISALTTAQSVLAVVVNPERNLDFHSLTKGYSLVLDDIQDPGNLGTILRIVDWFGIKQVLCGENTVECYNPKVVQASMGSIFRVPAYYGNLKDLFEKNNTELKLPVYGTVLGGENIYQSELLKNGFILFGNESNGIHKDLLPFVDHQIAIPSFYHGKSGPDSLNVSIAVGIVCSEFLRRSD
ncbi:MAG TPA: RNA methyltransferase [Bacteroidia bacterium]|nr:RNA methyltransferase [Bacteroidia bacterium]HNP98574.1 RNA methyltransferase [Bacteroidia bacterium]